MRTAPKQIRWPVRGVETITAYHDATSDAAIAQGHAYPAPFALNVRTLGPIEERMRGGSRPGLSPVPQGAFVRDFHPAVSVPAAERGDAPDTTLAAKYRDRVFAASGADWFCSRMGRHADWDYGADMGDTTRAVAGNLAFAGDRGETITAIMPVDDGTLYLATEHTLWRLQGDPASGQMHLVSREYGCVGPKAWCCANQRLLFVSHRGFTSLSYGEMPVLKSEALPGFPVDADTILGFDAKTNCAWSFSRGGVFMVEVGMGTVTAPFWPMSFASLPSAVGSCDGRVAFLMDGAWMRLDESVPCESLSFVGIGPFRISASDDSDGFLAEIHATLAEGGADVSAHLFTARSAERATKLAIAGEGGAEFEFAAGWNPVWRPRARGAWAVLVLSCQSGRWAFEAARAVCRQLGRLRP